MAIAVGVPAMRLWSFGKISPMELVRAIAAMVRKSAYLIRSRTRDEKLHREAEALKEFQTLPLFKKENKWFSWNRSTSSGWLKAVFGFCAENGEIVYHLLTGSNHSGEWPQ